MSGRLLRKVLKEQEQQQLNSADPNHEEESEPESPPAAAAAPSKNPFDLLVYGDASGDGDQVSPYHLPKPSRVSNNIHQSSYY